VVESSTALANTYAKLNTLMSQVYPDYGTNNFMRAPLVRVTVGNYIYRVPGFLESVNIQVDQDSTWEIGLTPKYQGKVQLPHYLNVNISFRPIMDKLPRKNFVTSNLSPLIRQ
jgi:hypothetical protein